MNGSDDNEEDVLLYTKLKMPRPRRNYVVRSALFEKLNRCLETSVIFIKGAAGTGKTTLLSSYIVETGLKNTAWLSLDESDNGLFPFWHYFTAAVSCFWGESPETLLQHVKMSSNIKNYLTSLINRLSNEINYYVILDDFHFITEPTLITSLEFFFSAMPENFHLFILSRENPPFYIGALEVSGKLLRLSSNDMRFSNDESMRFLKSTMNLKTSEAELERICRLADGWVGGLQLAAAGGRLSDDLFKNGETPMTEYMTREIFMKLLPDERNFLVSTGILPWFSENICKQLVPKLNFTSILNGLLDKNLFITCIDDVNAIYCYHPILRGYLEQQFRSWPYQQQCDMLCRAASVFEVLGYLEESVCLFIKAEHYSNAMKIISKLDMTANVGEYLKRIPQHILVNDLNLSIRRLIYHIDCSDFSAANQLSVELLKKWRGSPISMLLKYTVIVFMKDPYNNALPIPPTLQIQQTVNSAANSETQAFILLGYSNLAMMNCQYKLAERYIDEALKLSTCNVSTYFYSMEMKAQFLEETGNLNDSIQIYSKAENLLKTAGYPFMQEYVYLIGVAGIFLKRMELARAEKVLLKAKKILNEINLPDAMIVVGFDYNIAEYDMLSGQTEKGKQKIQEIIQSSETQSLADRLLIELCAAGLMNDSLAESLLREFNHALETNERLLPAFELLSARLYLQKGETDKAEKIANKVVTFSRENQNRLRLIEADLLLLRITNASTSEGRRKRNNLLREAIYYSWENRILQPFFVDWDVVKPLLENINNLFSDQLAEEERLFIKDIIRICSRTDPFSKNNILSSRELEVLIEIAKKKTNPQIAEELNIALSTVKSHALSIYGKLGVSSRANAIKEAKRLGLIQEAFD